MGSTMGESITSADSGMVQAVDRAFRILEYMVDNDDDVGIRDISKATGLHKSTVYRLLNTLRNRSYVEQNRETGKYRISVRTLELGTRVYNRMDLRREARRFLEELAGLTQETVHLTILDQGEVVYIDKVESPHTIRMYSKIGRRSPAHCTGVGKMLLAFLEPEEIDEIIESKGLKKYTSNTITDPVELKKHLAEIRRRGYSFDDSEHERGIRCVAAPVRDFSGKVVASVSVTGPAMRMRKEKMEELVGPVTACASKISKRMGWVDQT